MRRIVSFVPALLWSGVFGFLSIAFREFSVIIFLIALSFIASGVFSCLERQILSLICGLAPAAYFVYEGLTVSDPASTADETFLWLAGAIVLFYVCYYVSVAVYHRELNGK